MKFAALSVGLVALLTAAAAADRELTPTRGTVLGIIGVWKKDRKPLRFGNEVDVSDTLSTDRSGSITVGFSDGVASYSCDAACKHSVAIGDKKNITWKNRILAAVLPVIWKDGDRLIAAVSRGTDLAEAVVPLNANQVDLSRMLPDLAPGAYSARFKPLGQGGSPLTGKFSYAADTPALLTIAGLGPGLYQVDLFNGDGQPLGAEAWVLVSGPNTYGQNSELFKQASEVTATWSANSDARSVRAFLRAYLEVLAQQQAAR